MEKSTQYQKLFQDTFNSIQEENKNLKDLNILISGKSGVGKSTLINAIFGDKLSDTGVGLPITDKISLISKDGFPVHIYDTIGLELKSVKMDIHSIGKAVSKNEVKKLIHNVQKTKQDDDDIHVVWYAISGNSARIEEPEIDLIKWIIKHEIPVIIVLTKSFDNVEAQKLKQSILELVPDIEDVVVTLAEDSETKHAFGIDKLINETFKVLPEEIKTSFVHSQAASYELKRKEAIKVVNTSMAANFGVGFVPVDGADGPMMMAAQTAMIGKITSIYGVDIHKNQIETVISSLLGVYGSLILGKSLSSNLLKLIPGLGSVGGGLISGGVGMIITGALGRAYIELMELVLDGKVNLSSATPDEITEILISLFPKYLPKMTAK